MSFISAVSVVDSDDLFFRRGRRMFGIWLREKWLEGLSFVILIVVLTGVLDLRDRVSRLEEKAQGTVERVDRIAQALPSLGVQIAYESVFAPISSAVLVTKPTDIGKGRAILAMYLIDAKSGRIETFTKETDGKEMESIVYTIKSKFYEINKSSMPVSRVEFFSVDIKQPKISPALLDKQASFIFFQPYDKLAGILTDVGMRPAYVVAGKPALNWAEFSSYLGAATWLKSDPTH